jgi:RNA polymerase sigma factor (sigma-70 family)
MVRVPSVRHRTDADLLAAVRRGEIDAYGELYRRHSPMARAVAGRILRSSPDADDVAAEAFTRVLRALRAGRGPHTAFAPYLAAAVRNISYDRIRRSRESPVDDVDDAVDELLADAVRSRDEAGFVTAAFRALPERWRRVLWHTEVEGRTPAELAALLGLAPNAVAALAYRAREGLRQAYVQAHLREQRAHACRECMARLAGYVRAGLSPRDRRKVVAHLHVCPRCTELAEELSGVNDGLRTRLAPARGGGRQGQG